MANKYQSESKAREKYAEVMSLTRKRIEINAKTNTFYCAHMHSKGAERAFQEHKKPFRDWTVAALTEEMNRIMKKEGYKKADMLFINRRMKNIGRDKLRQMLLVSTNEKHHVGRYYALVRFHEMDEDKAKMFAKRTLAN